MGEEREREREREGEKAEEKQPISPKPTQQRERLFQDSNVHRGKIGHIEVCIILFMAAVGLFKLYLRIRELASRFWDQVIAHAMVIAGPGGLVEFLDIDDVGLKRELKRSKGS